MAERTIQIRAAEPNDTKVLAALMTELGYPTTAEEMEERFRTISEHADYKTYVSVDGQTITGMVGLIKAYYFEKPGCYIRVAAMIVQYEYRGKGIGKALMQRAEEWGLEKGADSVLLNSGNREERKVAHLFYKRLGYEAKSTGFFKRIKKG